MNVLLRRYESACKYSVIAIRGLTYQAAGAEHGEAESAAYHMGWEATLSPLF